MPRWVWCFTFNIHDSNWCFTFVKNDSNVSRVAYYCESFQNKMHINKKQSSRKQEVLMGSSRFMLMWSRGRREHCNVTPCSSKPLIGYRMDEYIRTERSVSGQSPHRNLASFLHTPVYVFCNCKAGWVSLRHQATSRVLQ